MNGVRTLFTFVRNTAVCNLVYNVYELQSDKFGNAIDSHKTNDQCANVDQQRMRDAVAHGKRLIKAYMKQ